MNENAAPALEFGAEGVGELRGVSIGLGNVPVRNGKRKEANAVRSAQGRFVIERELLHLTGSEE